MRIGHYNVSPESNMTTSDESLLWDVRASIYQHFASTARPPSIDETATRFQISAEQAAAIYEELHRRHALFLDAGTLTIRMANPFSAAPTTFRVRTQGAAYWANCAWDAFGIPAALHCDATIEAICSESRQSIDLSVRDAKVVSHGEVVHFLVPFRRWYDDLLFT